MDPLINADPPDTEPEPTIPLALLKRLLHLFSVQTLNVLVEHGEIVEVHGHGQLTVTWRDGKPDLVYHQASDRV